MIKGGSELNRLFNFFLKTNETILSTFRKFFWKAKEFTEMILNEVPDAKR